MDFSFEIVSEGYSDRVVLSSIINGVLPSIKINLHTKFRGKASLFRDNQHQKFLQLAKYDPSRIVVFSCDLDDETECISGFLQKYKLEDQSDNFLCIVIEQELESWLLADEKGMGKWLGIASENFEMLPKNRDLKFPKRVFLDLVRRKASDKWRGLLLSDDFQKPGDYYVEEMLNFVSTFWSYERAMQNSKSLKRFLDKLNALK